MCRVQPLLCSDFLCTFSRRRIHATIEELFFLCGPCRGVIKRQRRLFKSVEFRKANQRGCELGSRGIELRESVKNAVEWLRIDGKKGIRLCRYLYVLQLQWDWYNYLKSIASIRLVKNQETSECVTVNCKVCISARVLCYLWFRYKPNHPIQNPSTKSCTPKSWQYKAVIYIEMQKKKKKINKFFFCDT
jgi:hypothetical protein